MREEKKGNLTCLPSQSQFFKTIHFFTHPQFVFSALSPKYLCRSITLCAIPAGSASHLPLNLKAVLRQKKANKRDKIQVKNLLFRQSCGCSSDDPKVFVKVQTDKVLVNVTMFYLLKNKKKISSKISSEMRSRLP